MIFSARRFLLSRVRLRRCPAIERFNSSAWPLMSSGTHRAALRWREAASNRVIPPAHVAPQRRAETKERRDEVLDVSHESTSGESVNRGPRAKLARAKRVAGGLPRRAKRASEAHLSAALRRRSSWG